LKIWSVTTKLGILTCLAAAMLCGCGAAYQASTQIRSHRMLDSLAVGQTMPEVRQQWGQPDIITDQDQNTETWSYASRPNSNDIAATLLYTAAKEGDTGQFLDLRFVDGKLVSWGKQQHTMPAKRQSFGVGFGIASPHDATHF
jgi:outer membrane protein assembly factor BamE (lipoprotein component of BamABCDE complex)